MLGEVPPVNPDTSLIFNRVERFTVHLPDDVYNRYVDLQ